MNYDDEFNPSCFMKHIVQSSYDKIVVLSRLIIDLNGHFYTMMSMSMSIIIIIIIMIVY